MRDVILCGTDFSDPARQAADVAAGLAIRLERPLLLVHVSPPGAGAGTRDALNAEAARLRQSGAQVVDEWHDGHADEVLVKRARSAAARLVVLGSAGSRGGRRRLGSVSERTAEVTPAPTLVVRSGRALQPWVNGKRPLRVFLAFDYTVTAEAALNWVADLRQVGPCEVTVGYANWPDTRSAMGMPPEPSALANPPVVQEALERDLRARVEAMLGDGAQVIVRAARGRADLALIELAAASNADLMVTGTHQQHGLGRLWAPSVSRGLLHHALASVAVVPVVQGGRRLPPVPELRRVLAATDLSPLANRAIAHACAIAVPGGILRLVHVVHPRALAGGRFVRGPWKSEQHEQFVRASARRLHALIPPDAAARGITVEAQVVEAEAPAAGLAQEAERFGADVVVVGSQGRSALGRVLLGSVAQALMSATTRPVFVVRFPKE